MSDSEDIRTFIRELFEECDRKLDASEARIKKDREELRAHGPPERAPEQLDFTEDRRQRALLLEKARQLGKRRPEPPSAGA
jgi:hypothetical protein